jgi:hypothetical protein
MYKKYPVLLTPEQRQLLRDRLASGRLTPAAATRVRILLKADAAPGGPAWTDAQLGAAFDLSTRSVMRVRQTFVTQGFDAALARRPPGPRRHKIEGAIEAHHLALICSPPPEGYARWSVRLVSERLVELVDLESVSYETVRRTLKKLRRQTDLE